MPPYKIMVLIVEMPVRALVIPLDRQKIITLIVLVSMIMLTKGLVIK